MPSISGIADFEGIAPTTSVAYGIVDPPEQHHALAQVYRLERSLTIISPRLRQSADFGAGSIVQSRRVFLWAGIPHPSTT